MPSRPRLRIGSIPVHVEWPFFLIAAMLGWWGVDSWPGNRFLYILIWIAIVFVSVLVHELGHAIAYRAFGQRPSITLAALWGLTHGERELPRNRAIVVSLAGSLTAMVVLGIPALLWRDHVYSATHSVEAAQVVYYIGWVNLWWSLANLLPILPLDGGEVTRLIWGQRVARIASVGAGAGVALWLFVIGNQYAAFFIGMLAMMNLGEAMSEGFIGNGRSAFGGMGRRGDGYDYRDDPPRKAPKQRKKPKSGRRQGKSKPPLTLINAPSEVRARPIDGAKLESAAWDALRQGDAAGAAELLESGKGRVFDAHLVATVAAAQGKTDDALVAYARAFAVMPTLPNLMEARIIARAGIATALAAKLLDDPTIDVDATADLQNHLHYAEAFADAARVGELLVADARRSVAQSSYEVACAWARTGDLAASTEWLRRAVEAGFHAASVIESEEDLVEVRALPSYRDVQALLHQS